MRRLSLMFCLPALLVAAEPAVRDMSLITPDGFVLKGTLSVPAQPGPRPLVILAHQFQSTRSGWKPLVDRLNSAGLATLAMDLRGHGESIWKGGQTVAISSDYMASAKDVEFGRIPADIIQVAAWARRQPRIDPRRLALAGSSLGAFASLVAASTLPPLAVLAVSPAGNGAFQTAAGNPLVADVEAAHSAVLVMAAADDLEAASNATLLQSIPGVYARIVAGGDHGFAFLPGDVDLMAGWLTEYLTYQRPR